MDSPHERLKTIRILALLLTALSLAIVLVSAYIRLSGAGLGCTGWPDCYGQLLAGGQSLHVGGARILHRVVASSALLLGFYLVARCLRPTRIATVANHATVLLLLMIALTFVGVWSSDPHRAWASFINILGGVALVVLSWRMVLAATPDPAPARTSPPSMLLHAGLLALILVIALGAMIGARYAASACISLPSCNGVYWPAAAGWAALDPFTTVAAAAGPGDQGGVALHLLHRYGALATLLLLGIAGFQALAQTATRAGAGLMLGLLLTQVSLGILIVLSGFSLWPAIAHGLCATLLLTVAVQLAIRSRARTGQA
jgi:heme a synthase